MVVIRSCEDARLWCCVWCGASCHTMVGVALEMVVFDSGVVYDVVVGDGHNGAAVGKCGGSGSGGGG